LLVNRKLLGNIAGVALLQHNAMSQA